MLFNSFEFIFLFLPIFLIAHTLIKNVHTKNIVLVIFSLFFYSWGEPTRIFYLFIISVICYGLCFLIKKNKSKVLFVFSILVIVLPLLLFKYYFNSMPLGISFFSFQLLSYLIDVYNNKINHDNNYIKFETYISLFMTISSGPIIRYIDIEKQLDDRETNIHSIENGLSRFVIGLFKKVVIADGIARIADIVFSANVHTLPLNLAWLGAISYMLQIYYDFSGYSDMAIGIGKMAGFDFKENFDNPYYSRSISEFWRRWHISLGNWFRDYIYIPLGGNRVSDNKWIFNIFVVWLLTGMWHGKSLNFVVWGLYFGVFIVLEKRVFKKILDKYPKMSNIYTLLIVLGGWIIFRIDNIINIPYYFFSMIDVRYIGQMQEIINYDVAPYIIYVVLALILLVPKVNSGIKDAIKKHTITGIFIVLLAFIVSIIYIENSSYTAFLYFKF